MWLLAKLAVVDEDEEAPCESEAASDADDSYDVIVWTEEYGDVDVLTQIVCEFQTKFNKTEPWSMEYAQTCSKPRIGEFGGGAVICFQGKDHWINTGQWVFETTKALIGG